MMLRGRPMLGCRLLLLALTISLPVAAPAAAIEAVGAPVQSIANDLFKGETQDPYRVAMRAYVWGYPLVRAAQIRHNTTLPDDPFRVRPPSVAGAPINRFGHAKELATPETRHGVAPNNDTLYSLAWLDLNDGPFVLETPYFGARYYTFQMGQADSSTDVALGQRTHGSRLPPVFIQGPGKARPVPAGMAEVRSKQRYLMIAGRILVEGPEDLPNVHSLQNGVRLRRWADYVRARDVPPPVTAQRPLVGGHKASTQSVLFFEMLGAVLQDWRTAPEDRALLQSLQRIGLSTREGFRPERLSPAVLDRLAQGARDGEKLVRQYTFSLGTRVNGWGVNYGGSQFGRDHLLRAAVAMDQIYVLPAAEALYPNARTDIQGKELDGRRSYLLRFAKDQLPPVDAFWSLTMYHAKGFMVPNPIRRYSIGDRTPGLVKGADGSIEILMQRDRPRDPAVNWLPTPAEPFMAMLRLYRPRAAVQSGAWSPPGVTEVPAR